MRNSAARAAHYPWDERPLPFWGRRPPVARGLAQILIKISAHFFVTLIHRRVKEIVTMDRQMKQSFRKRRQKTCCAAKDDFNPPRGTQICYHDSQFKCEGDRRPSSACWPRKSDQSPVTFCQLTANTM